MTNDSDQTRAILPEDDYFRRSAWPGDPWWNESALFCFSIPEHDIGGYFYCWHRPNMNLTAGGVALWDPHGTERHNCKYFDWFNFNPLTTEADMFDFSLANGMSCALIEPLHSYRLRYQNPNCTFDLLWEGVHPVQNLHFHNEGADDPIAVFGAFHYEQIGHVTGTVTCEGQTLEVDCHDFRDRSRGIRGPMRGMPGGGFDVAWAPSGTAFCATMIREDPTAPVSTSNVDRPGRGYILRDDKIGKIVDGRRQVTERDTTGAARRVTLELTDDLNRELHAEAEIRSHLKWHELWYVNWGTAAWTVDGEAAWGQSQDWIDADTYRTHQRNLATPR